MNKLQPTQRTYKTNIETFVLQFIENKNRVKYDSLLSDKKITRKWMPHNWKQFIRTKT